MNYLLDVGISDFVFQNDRKTVLKTTHVDACTVLLARELRIEMTTSAFKLMYSSRNNSTVHMFVLDSFISSSCYCKLFIESVEIPNEADSDAQLTFEKKILKYTFDFLSVTTVSDLSLWAV